MAKSESNRRRTRGVIAPPDTATLVLEGRGIAAVNLAPPAPARIIRASTVLERVPFSDTTLWRKTRDGSFPKPIQLSKGCTGWLESDVNAWIAGRVAEAAGR